MKNTYKNTGFTLTELLVTIAIIVALTGIILANIGGSRSKARDATRVSDVGQIGLALNLYYDRCGQYPASLDASASTGCPSGVTLGSFISQIPTPPAGVQGVTAYDYATLSSSGGTPVNYVLHTVLEGSNVAVTKGLSSMPSGSWSSTYTCSNLDTSINYCITSN